MFFILNKILYLIIMMLLISIISFGAIHLSPNSFFASGALNPNITQESIDILKSVYGLEKPLITQYYLWLISIVQLDFGISFTTGTFVKDEILSRISITLILNLISLVFIYFIAFYLGIFSAISKKSSTDTAIKNVALISYSMPSFYLALISIYIFSYYFEIFPLSGLHSIDIKEDSLSYYTDMLWHLVLPISVIFFGGVGSLTLYIRGLVNEILKSDYIFYAKSRGLSQSIIIRHYILPNLKPPAITLLGLSLPSVIGGSIILESIFSIDGMGLLFFQSAMSHDYPVIMGILIIGAFLTLLGNMIADIILIKVNPFISHSM